MYAFGYYKKYCAACLVFRTFFLKPGFFMSILLTIKVFPGAGRQSFVLDKSGIIKCFIKNQAEKGKANNEVVKLLATKLGVSRDAIIILKGTTNSRKIIKITTDLDQEKVFQALGISYQCLIVKE